MVTMEIMMLITFYYVFKLTHSATGKVLASELPKDGNKRCTVLYPASVKASNEIGMVIVMVF